MLTNLEWFHLLPEPYGERAIHNAIATNREDLISWCMSDAINVFTWCETSEGREYWQSVYNSYKEADTTARHLYERNETLASEKRLRDAILEKSKRAVVYSSSMKTMLNALVVLGCKVSWHLPDDDYWTNEFANYITTRKGMLSYLANGRDHKVNDNGRWDRVGRQEMKPAKLAKKLLLSGTICGRLIEADFEKFSNNVKSYLGIVGDEDGDGKTLSLRVVNGEDIRKAYLGDNYSKILGSESNLHNSCMRDANRQEYLNIFVDNTKVVSLLIAEDSDNKILGRALLWVFDNGDKGMDTIYGPDIVIQSFKNWASDNDYYLKSRQSCHHHLFDIYNDNILHDDLIRKVSLEKWDYQTYPYMDSLFRLEIDEKRLHNSTSLCYDRELRNVDGTWIDENGDNSDGDDNEDDNDGDDRVELNNGEWVDEEDARWLHYQNYAGEWREAYYLADECSCCYNGEWMLDNDVVEIGNRCYPRDHHDITFINGRDEWALLDDTVYCESNQEYILMSDAVELAGEGWCHEDDARRCDTDGLYYMTDDMTMHGNVWVADCNTETYLETLKIKSNENETA